DDIVCLHSRLCAALDRDWIGRGFAPDSRHGGHRRHAGRHRHRGLSYSRDFLSRRETGHQCQQSQVGGGGWRFPRSGWNATLNKRGTMTKPTDPHVKSVKAERPSHRRLLQPLFCRCTLLFLAAGCAVGPNYRRPAVDSPATFRGEPTATTNSFADLAWWEVYQDPTLQALIREGLTNNYDLRIAVTRVEQARASAMQARSQFVPGITYDSTVSRGRNELLGSEIPNGGATGSDVSGTLNAFWEVD